MLNKGQVEIIRSIFADINGQKINSIGRAGSMVWIGIGGDIFCTNTYGEVIKKSEYALHIQCAFRIRNDEKCILSFQDIFEPRTDIEYSDSFVWDLKDANLYDEVSNNINKYIDEYIINIERIDIDSTGDLYIYLSNNMIIEIFVDSSYGECWRFFKVNVEKEQHLVLYGNKMELE